MCVCVCVCVFFNDFTGNLFIYVILIFMNFRRSAK